MTRRAWRGRSDASSGSRMRARRGRRDASSGSMMCIIFNELAGSQPLSVAPFFENVLE